MTWETVPLGEVARFVRGVTYKPGDVVANGADGVACLRTKNIQSTLDLTDLVCVRSDLKHRVEQRVQEDDVLVSSANSWHLVGRAVQAGADAEGMLIGGFIGGLRFKPEDISPRYGYYWFSSPVIQAKVRSFGQQTTNISNLNVDRTLRLPIPLPPLPEQRRIVAILDEADALRTTAVTATERVDDARAALFEHLFPSAGEDLTTIGALIESTQYGTSGKAGGTGRFPILRMGNLTARGRIDLRDMKYIDIPDQEVEKYLVRKGDVLFNRTNSAELVGKTAVYREDVPRAYAGYLVRLRASDEFIAEYIAGYLNSVHGKRTLRRMAKSIVGMANINAREVQTIRLPAPSAEKMHAYKAFVDESWSNTARFESRARELDSLFASLQHRAFRGEL
ncbi:restriction endonuclease S subunits [Microbacterium testaceum StLB037]|uniref:Restriction endonuclease S subunits n=1 Tax=Microbacterium testaceum (strain StLB037) TaxID=979556 RepID=E8N9S5_MICTS|nr:restriction endonuclease subunit S [Microbacterium testaceum]BAJ74544.1 restriction endonuclease S subunits [Microbacterium testaceum StLB037]